MARNPTSLVVLLYSLGCCPLLFAQTATQPSAEAKDPLAARQQIVRDRMVQLEDRMYRLTEKLNKTEPEQAKRLEKALHESGELLIRHHMDAAVESLEKAQLADAAEHQTAAEKALEQILTLLTETADDTLERQRELDRMNQLREQVDKLLDKQSQLRSRTDPGEQIARRLAEAAAKVQKLIEQQTAEVERGRKADPSDAGQLSESQAKVREDTAKVIGDLNQPATRPEGVDPLAQAADQARRNLQDAADQMRSAEEQFGKGKQTDAQADQSQALKSLNKALEALKKAASDASPLETAEAAKQQQNLEQEAGKLADSMHDEAKPGSESKPAGEQSPASKPSAESQPEPGQQSDSGEQGENQDQQSGPSKPGADNVRRAQQHMNKASNKLQSGKQSKATEDQDKAIEELKQAKAELQETLDQLRREQQEEMLAGLEQRFRTMLIEQQAINTATADLDARKDKWTRNDSLNLASLAEKQTALSGEAAKALNILVEEGTTVVFPQIVVQVRDDMTDVAKRLGEKQTGPVTRGIQDQIIETLQELIAAIEQRQKDGPPPGGGDQAGGQQSDQDETPLLPSSAELKLLRSSQTRINKQTGTLETAAEESPDDLRDQAQRLSTRQDQLAEMARKINDRGQRK